MEHGFELHRGTDLLCKCFHFTGVGIAALMLQLSRCFMFHLSSVQPRRTDGRLWIPSESNMYFWQIFIHFAHVLPGFGKKCPDLQMSVKSEPRVDAVCRSGAPDHECGDGMGLVLGAEDSQLQLHSHGHPHL